MTTEVVGRLTFRLNRFRDMHAILKRSLWITGRKWALPNCICSTCNMSDAFEYLLAGICEGMEASRYVAERLLFKTVSQVRSYRYKPTKQCSWVHLSDNNTDAKANVDGSVLPKQSKDWPSRLYTLFSPCGICHICHVMRVSPREAMLSRQLRKTNLFNLLNEVYSLCLQST